MDSCKHSCIPGCSPTPDTNKVFCEFCKKYHKDAKQHFYQCKTRIKKPLEDEITNLKRKNVQDEEDHKAKTAKMTKDHEVEIAKITTAHKVELAKLTKDYKFEKKKLREQIEVLEIKLKVQDLNRAYKSDELKDFAIEFLKLYNNIYSINNIFEKISKMPDIVFIIKNRNIIQKHNLSNKDFDKIFEVWNRLEVLVKSISS